LEWPSFRCDVAVYERSLDVQSEPHELEIVLIRVVPEKVMPDGARVPEREAYPTPSEWGRYGWSVPIRALDLALDLARSSAHLMEGRAGFMREALHNFWRTTRSG
jgi:hypothetical protein